MAKEEIKALNRLCKILSVSAVLCIAANAQTYISSWGTVISSGGIYSLTNAISSNSETTPGITVTGVTGGVVNVTIDCNGYTVSDTAPDGGAPLLYAYNNSPGVTVGWNGCPWSAPNAGQSSSGTGSILIKETGVDAEEGNSYTNVTLNVQCLGTGLTHPSIRVLNGTWTNSFYTADKCTANFSSNTMSGYTAANSQLTSPVLIFGEQNPTANYNLITGYLNGQGAPTMDDGILIAWDGTNPTYNLQMNGNAISHMRDLCMELVGGTRYSTITYNFCSDTVSGMLGEYYNTSLDHVTVQYNTMAITETDVFTPTFDFLNQAPIPNSYFTNNTFLNNTVTGITAQNGFSTFNYGDAPFTTVANNAMGSNDLGMRVQLQSAIGWLDVGRNICGSTFPSGVVNCR